MKFDPTKKKGGGGKESFNHDSDGGGGGGHNKCWGSFNMAMGAWKLEFQPY